MKSVKNSVEINIAGRLIGPEHRPYIIAELSANHLQQLDKALAIVEAAKAAGADAVKLQTYTPDSITINHDGPEFRIKGGLWDGRSLYELYQEAAMPYEWHGALFEKGRQIGITVFSSPFEPKAIDMLEDLGCPAYKIASFEIVDLPLIRCAAATGKPMIISTGMATEIEIEEAVTAARDAGCSELILLHCVSGYPTPLEEINLATIPNLLSRFDVVVGLSDHTQNRTVPVAAIALGARVLEKHFTLDRADGGPDAAFSFEPHEMRDLVQGCKDAFSAIGYVNYGSTSSEKGNVSLRRSLYVVKDVCEGEILTEENIRSIRPGLGLSPKYLPEVIGRKARRQIKSGSALSWEMLVD